MSIWWKINIVLISVIVLFGLYELFVRIMMRRSAKIISQEEFQAGTVSYTHLTLPTT